MAPNLFWSFGSKVLIDSEGISVDVVVVFVTPVTGGVISLVEVALVDEGGLLD